MWIDLLLDNRALKSIYHNEEISLDNVNLISVEIRNLVSEEIETTAEMNLLINFDLNQYPQNPPLKWVNRNNNTVNLTLCILENEVISFQRQKLSAVRGNLKIDPIGDHKLVTFSDSDSKNPTLEIKCRWIYLYGMRAYHKEPEH